MKIVIVAIILLLVLWFISTYNKLISSRMKVREAFSTMDIYLKKRFDLIPNLVETVKGYMGHENDTLTKIAELRSRVASNPTERMENEKEISSAISRLLVVSENYPELKADRQFLDLQNHLKSLENDIEKSRRYYNGTVTNLNTMVNMIPTNIVASIANIKEELFFEIEQEERKNVEIKF